jgi:hypothetical protein
MSMLNTVVKMVWEFVEKENDVQGPVDSRHVDESYVDDDESYVDDDESYVDESGDDKDSGDESYVDESGDDEDSGDESYVDESGDDEDSGDESYVDESGNDEDSGDESGDDEDSGDESGDDEDSGDESYVDESGDDEDSGDDESYVDESGSDEDSGEDEEESIPHLIDEATRDLKKQLKEVTKEFADFKDVQNARFLMLQTLLNEVLGGLYNRHTQKKTVDKLANMLYMHPYTESQHINTSAYRDRPTTRQGDECEKRIAKIEKTLRMGACYENENRLDSIERKMNCEPLVVRVRAPANNEMTYDKARRLGLSSVLYGV